MGAALGSLFLFFLPRPPRSILVRLGSHRYRATLTLRQTPLLMSRLVSAGSRFRWASVGDVSDQERAAEQKSAEEKKRKRALREESRAAAKAAAAPRTLPSAELGAAPRSDRLETGASRNPEPQVGTRSGGKEKSQSSSSSSSSSSSEGEGGEGPLEVLLAVGPGISKAHPLVLDVEGVRFRGRPAQQ